MKPNFALSLSLDGIRLLHRAAGGWHVVGDVDVDTKSLAAELAVLRRTATSLEPGGVRSKLVIPNSQIRYLTIETPGLEPAARHAAARRALEGATPYAVEELVFDISPDGEKTHVAAVARETLEEVEAFATEHRFYPVSFVAVPDDGDFKGEPFFGPTKAATDLLDTGQMVAQDPSTIVARTDAAQPPLADFEPAPEPASFSSRRQPVEEPRVPVAATVPVPESAARLPAAPVVIPPPRPVPMAPPKVPAAPSRATTASLSVPGADVETQRSGSGRRLVLLMALLVLFLAGLAAWASTGFGTGLSDLVSRAPPDTDDAAPAQFVAPVSPIIPEEALPAPTVEQTALQTELTDEEAAVLDAMRAPALADPEPAPEPTEDERRAAYAVTGIWPFAPDVPAPVASVDLEDLYVPSIDPINPAFDAVALPTVVPEDLALAFQAPNSPAAAGTEFALDARGLVAPSAAGTLSPDGVRVFAGAPPLRPPATLARIEEPGENPAVRAAVSGLRPQARPADLIETTERATLDGLTRSELAQLRPRLRPVSAQENALAAASLVPSDAGRAAPLSQQGADAALAAATDLAVAESLRPDARPNNFGQIVERATTEEAEEEAAEPVQTASVAPRAVVPNIPSSASVSREATQTNAIRLREVNLIGVYGKPSDRRALVRLPNGRFQKVQVGDRIDGGRISAIGDSELRYQKGNRNLVLKMP